MDTSDYLIMLMRMIRTSERPSNAESQNVGFSSLIGSTFNVSIDRPCISADKLTRASELTAGINEQFQGRFIPDSSCYQCAGIRVLEENRKGGNDRRD